MVARFCLPMCLYLPMPLVALHLVVHLGKSGWWCLLPTPNFCLKKLLRTFLGLHAPNPHSRNILPHCAYVIFMTWFQPLPSPLLLFWFLFTLPPLSNGQGLPDVFCCGGLWIVTHNCMICSFKLAISSFIFLLHWSNSGLPVPVLASCLDSSLLDCEPWV